MSRFDSAYIPLVIEEAAEVQQAACKLLRFGVDHRYRTGQHQGRTNTEALAYEVGDLLEVIEHLGLPAELIEEGRRQKRERLRMYGPHTWRPGIEDEEPAANTATCRCGRAMFKDPQAFRSNGTRREWLKPWLHLDTATAAGEDCDDA